MGQTVGCGHATPRLLASMLMPMKEHPPKTIGLAKLTQPVAIKLPPSLATPVLAQLVQEQSRCGGTNRGYAWAQKCGCPLTNADLATAAHVQPASNGDHSESFLCHSLLKRLTSHLARSNNEVFFIEKLA